VCNSCTERTPTYLSMNSVNLHKAHHGGYLALSTYMYVAKERLTTTMGMYISMSLSLLVGRRYRKRINGSINHIIIGTKDDINLVMGLLCQCELPCTHMGTIGLRRRKICQSGRIDAKT